MPDKDDNLIYWINELRLATRKHLGRVTGRNNSWLHESLMRLVAQKRIYLKKQPKGSFSGNIYATYDIRKYDALDHNLPLTDIHISLFETGRLLEWDQPRQKFEDELNEDAWFELDIGNDEFIKYYLEYETGKNRWSQVDDKFRRYLERRKEEQFHVLFIMKDEQLKKVSNMVSRAQRFIPKDKPSRHKWFLFTTFQAFIDNPLGDICSYTHSSDPCSLIPPP